jgi:hypothetical protein
VRENRLPNKTAFRKQIRAHLNCTKNLCNLGPPFPLYLNDGSQRPSESAASSQNEESAEF